MSTTEQALEIVVNALRREARHNWNKQADTAGAEAMIFGAVGDALDRVSDDIELKGRELP